jgi:uncharacterized protein YjbI with pentapeptide repeats/calcineurin-like phosphoesterase family protein
LPAHPYLKNFLTVVGFADIEQAGCRRDDQQHELLHKCATDGCIDQWNEWRRQNAGTEVWMSGADLRKLDLRKADLRGVHLEYANLFDADLREANLREANLTHAYLSNAKLEGTLFEGANLTRMRARGVTVDGCTHIWHVVVDYFTDFSGVPLKNARVEPAVRAILEANERDIDPDWWYHGKLAKVLHLSDLHFGGTSDAELWYSQLAQDLVNELGCASLEAIIVTGDISNRADPNEFSAAKKFLHDLALEFQVNQGHIIVVPGNHDVDWSIGEAAYQSLENSLTDEAVLASNLCNTRFSAYSHFHEEVTGSPYPTEFDKQFTIHLIPTHNLLVVGFNSAWHTDKRNPKRIGINMGAVAACLNYLREKRNGYKSYRKFAIWHHPVSNSVQEGLDDLAFLQLLAQAGFEVILHGHVHKAEVDEYRYDHAIDGRKLRIVGAGTFGAPTREWVPGYPLEYHLLTIGQDQVRVTTRCKREVNGAWQPDARWLAGAGNEARSYYVLKIPTRT